MTTHLTPDQIDELVEGLVLCPVLSFDDQRGRDDVERNALWLDHGLLDEVIQRAGVDKTTLHHTLKESRWPSYFLTHTAALRDLIAQSGMTYSDERTPLSKRYYLSLNKEGVLRAKYHQIIGGRELGTFSEAQIERLKVLMAKQLVDREGVAPSTQLLQDLVATAKAPDERLDYAVQLLGHVNQAFSEGHIKSLEHSRLREQSIAQGLSAMAQCCGISLRQPLQIDTNGEFALVVESIPPAGGPNPPAGQFGEAFAHELSQYSTRTGERPTRTTVLPENGWTRIHHFDAEKMVIQFTQQRDQEVEADVAPVRPKMH